MKKIKVEPYTADWIRGYNALKEAYIHHLNGNYRIVHLGSTAIPGMASRPIVDIDIIVSHPGEIIDLQGQLTYLGYLSRFESEDKDLHVLTRALHEVPLLKEDHSKWVSHHLNLCLEDSLFYRSRRAMHKYMMDHPLEIKAYSDLKRALAHKYGKDLQAYQKDKAIYIHEVLKTSGFTGEDIKMLNNYQFI